MTAPPTKAIAARIPFDEYIKVITKASDLRLTISDYIIMKLNSVDRVSELEHELKTVQATVVSLRQELDKTKNLVLSHEADLAKWQTHAKGLEGSAKTGQGELATVKGETASLTKKLADATAREKALQKQIADLTASIGEWEKYSIGLKGKGDTSAVQYQAEVARLNKHATDQNTLLANRSVEVKRLNDELTILKSSLAAAVTKHRDDQAALTARHRDDQAKAKQLLAGVQAELDGLKQGVLVMFEELKKEHKRSTLNIIPKAYWPMIERLVDIAK